MRVVRGMSWLCFAGIALSCGETSRNTPSGTGGGAGAGASGGSATGGSAGTGAGGSDAAGSGAGGKAPANGGSAGASGAGGGVGGSSGSGAGGSGTSGDAGSGDGGTQSAGNGGSAGTGSGGVPAGFPPFSAYSPVGEPIVLDGIVNASDIVWKPSTDSFFLLTDRTTTFHEYGGDFATPLRTITLVNSPVDAEGLAYLGAVNGKDRFALGVEANTDEVLVFELAADATTLDFATATLQTYVPGEEPAVANKGWEGVAYRAAAGGEPAWLWACQEGEPGQVPIRVVGFPYLPDGGTPLSYADDSLAVEEPWDAADELGAVADDLSGLTYDADSGTLLALSHLGSRVLRVDPATGAILDTLVLSRSPQYEGVTLAGGGRLVAVSEPNFVEIFQLGAD
jgi:uncharacterized protein YjiK